MKRKDAFAQFLTPARRNLELGEPAQARTLCAEFLERFPDDPEGLALAAETAHAAGDDQAAEELFARVVNRTPPYVKAYPLLADMRADQGRLWEAVECHAKWCELAPEACKKRERLTQKAVAEAGEALAAGQERRALRALARTLGYAPGHRPALLRMAATLRRGTNYAEAERFGLMAMERYPNDVDAINQYALTQSNVGRLQVSIPLFRKAVEANPKAAGAWLNLGCDLQLAGDLDGAHAALVRALEAASATPETSLETLQIFIRTCDFDALSRIDWWGMAESVSADQLRRYMLWLLTFAASPETNDQLLALQCRWGDWEIARAKAANPVPGPRRIAHRLRLGLISPDFRNHSVSKFTLPLFRGHDRERFEFFCYSTMEHTDAVKEEIKANVAAFAEVGSLANRDIAAKIKADGVDVLIDLGGFTRGSRSQVLAWRAAPVQVSWLGFPGSTGMRTVDYLFLDRYLAPGRPECIVEKPLITPGASVCFGQLDPVPINPDPPCVRNGHVTFGSLNNSYKINRAIIGLWAHVLARVPNSRFLFVRQEFDSKVLRRNVVAEFGRHGIHAERLVFYNNHRHQRSHLDCYNDMDISLDTFPVTGGTTTCDCLWMGVPVISLMGENVHQRVSYSILSHVGMANFVARSPQDYVTAAVAVAADRQLLVRARQWLRDILNRSLLCDTNRFIADFQETFLAAARRHGLLS
ncbi:O-linked N-acetylglucosamine transferase family protein [Desulfolutivibrio sulfoxidireducens]|uniref:O-linked N-acetylglucosamine transferase, SPINDLY family protein n=1 Tax=Desulfolutivibrio sulfoxidireducens TaxID=2773299 RepID=UPI00159DA975|nr:tetratricopeptide repeat protein [Desulfolutivibrio sulfoxidireducens]QLA18210.1 tetratricopeptide repeat protein [Desulfolutivibrio sulfoxidireducens]